MDAIYPRYLVVTGSRQRYWDQIRVDPEPIIADYLRGFDPGGLVLVHGDASGVDRAAGRAAEKLAIPVIAVPAEWEKHEECACDPDTPICPVAGPRRNRLMLRTYWPFRIGAFAATRETSGTRDCVKSAVAARVPVDLHLVGPDGHVVESQVGYQLEMPL
jgi:hypothetical protein